MKAVATIFEKLDRGRPPRQLKTGNSELTRDIERLHVWLQHRGKSTIALRDICYFGPHTMRSRKRALLLAEILAGRGLLIRKQARRYDRFEWQIAANPTSPQNG
jgi:hypothetical protein